MPVLSYCVFPLRHPCWIQYNKFQLSFIGAHCGNLTTFFVTSELCQYNHYAQCVGNDVVSLKKTKSWQCELYIWYSGNATAKILFKFWFKLFSADSH
jgi:hypothetical protein